MRCWHCKQECSAIAAQCVLTCCGKPMRICKGCGEEIVKETGMTLEAFIEKLAKMHAVLCP